MPKKFTPRSDTKTVRNDYIRHLRRERYEFKDIAKHMTEKGEPMTKQRVFTICDGVKMKTLSG